MNLRAYYAALKPERTYANVMTTAVGFLFASAWHIQWGLFVATIAGTTLVVMSACAVNNSTDRSIDARMPRTQKRGTVTGVVPIRHLVILAVLLGLAGFVVMLKYVNMLTLSLGAIAYIDYVVLYAWSKRTTVHSTLIGTISGSMPLVAGYTAVTGRFDLTALLLGLIMLFWQMVHFYSIGVFRKDDYAAADIPVWPVKKGIKSTQRWIMAYTVLYVAALVVFTVYSATSVLFAIVLGTLGLYWLFKGFKGFKSLEPTKWARGMFGFSLVVLLALSAGIALSPLLP